MELDQAIFMLIGYPVFCVSLLMGIRMILNSGISK